MLENFLYFTNVNSEAAADRRTLKVTAFQWQLGFENWHFVMLEMRL